MCCMNMGLKLKILKMSPELFAQRYMERVEDQTDHFANAFVHKMLRTAMSL